MMSMIRTQQQDVKGDVAYALRNGLVQNDLVDITTLLYHLKAFLRGIDEFDIGLELLDVGTVMNRHNQVRPRPCDFLCLAKQFFVPIMEQIENPKCQDSHNIA